MRRTSIVSGITRRLVLVAALIVLVALVALSELSFRQRIAASLSQAREEAVRMRALAATADHSGSGLRPTPEDSFAALVLGRASAAREQRQIDPVFPNLYFMLTSRNVTDDRNRDPSSFAISRPAVTFGSHDAGGLGSLRIDPSALDGAGLPPGAQIVGYGIPVPPPYSGTGPPLVSAVVARIVTPDPVLPMIAIGLGATLLIALVAEFVAARIRRRLARRVSAMVKVLDGADRADFAERIDVGSAEAELAELGEAVNGLLARVAEAVDQFRRLSVHIAHDLRTPILVAMKTTRSLHEAVGRTEARQQIDEVSGQLNLLQARLTRILLISDVEGHSGSSFEVVDLKAEVALVIEDFVEDRAAERGSRFATELEPCSIWGGRELIQRLLLNLLDNSARYAPSGSEIVVRLHADHAAARLEIGNQVPPDAKEAGAASAPREPDSFGLGLPFVRSVARRHGGDATWSIDGGRFTARVTLPLLQGSITGEKDRVEKSRQPQPERLSLPQLS